MDALWSNSDEMVESKWLISIRVKNETKWQQILFVVCTDAALVVAATVMLELWFLTLYNAQIEYFE